jgi:hypothetical protein
MTGEPVTPPGPPEHALLFAWLAEEAVRTLGPVAADGLIHAAVRRYGRERGGRMARRAARLGLPLDWVSYLALGEWRAPGHRVDLERAPEMHGQVLACPWNDAWESEGLAGYGRLYCRDIDRALVQGFNPAMAYRVARTLPAGDACCDFVSAGYAFDGAEEARLDALRQRLGTSAVMPWDYHLGHLYWAMHREFEVHIGAAGTAIAERALARCEARLGARVVRAIRDHATTDFALP